MYKKLPNNATPREVAEVVNGVLNGKLNSTGTIKVFKGSNRLIDERIGYESVILFSARSNDGFGLPFVESKAKGEAIVGYAGNNGTEYDYVVLG